MQELTLDYLSLFIFQDYVALRAEVYFPSVTMERYVVDFGCILNDTEVTRYLNMTNTSPMVVRYKWTFVVGSEPCVVINRPQVKAIKSKEVEVEVEVEKQEEENNVDSPVKKSESNISKGSSNKVETATEYEGRKERMKEGNVLFNDALNTFYLRLYGIIHMVKDHSDSERGNPLPPHGLLFPINSKGYFMCIITQTG